MKKNNTIFYLIGAAIVGVAGFFVYKKYQADKNTEIPTPDQTPTPTPTPENKTKTSTAASAAKISELQNLLIRRFVQLNRSSEYTKDDAKGGFGNKSRNALKTLRPQTYASQGDPNAANIQLYIDSINTDIETAAKESSEQKTKQTSTNDLKKLSKDIVDFVNKGGKAKIINDFSAIKHQFDAVKKTYIPLNESKKFLKGQIFFYKGQLIDRGNGQILIKDGSFRYPTTPQNFLTYN